MNNIRNHSIYEIFNNPNKHIPQEFLKNKQLCLWKYEIKNNQIMKVPYGINSKNQIQKNLKTTNLWIKYENLRLLSKKQQKEFGLGIILYQNNYTCIDIDNCLTKNNDQYNLTKKIDDIVKQFSYTYCEISPSYKGLHIFYRGSWSHELKKITHFDKNSNIEIYSTQDWRFITLTGILFNNYRNESTKIKQYLFNDKAIQYLHNLFNQYLKLKNTNNQYSTQTNDLHLPIVAYTLMKQVLKNISTNNKIEIYNSMKQGKQDKSESENDFNFCLFILNYIPIKTKNENIQFVLSKFLTKERYRDKIDRKDYINNTILKAIKYSTNNDLISSAIIKKILINKDINYAINNLIKVCNKTMNIFFINKIDEKQKFIFEENNDNYFEVYTVQGLDCNDLDIFTEILYQFSKQKCIEIKHHNNQFLEDQKVSIDLNIKQIAKRLNKVDSGYFRNQLMESIKKISLVNIIYNKKVQKNPESIILEGNTNLINYKIITKNHTKQYKKIKIEIELNLLSIYILKQSSYNYSIINTEHRNLLPKSELRLIYNYICLKTIPGTKYTKKIYLSELLDNLWNKTDNQSTLRTRRSKLKILIKEFQQYLYYVEDFNIKLINEETDKFNNIYIQIKRDKIKIK